MESYRIINVAISPQARDETFEVEFTLIEYECGFFEGSFMAIFYQLVVKNHVKDLKINFLS